MASGCRVVVFAGLLVSVAAPHPAAADPIAVTSGSATVAWDDPSWFEFHGSNFQLASAFFPVPVSAQNICFSGCAPGTSIDMTTIMGGTDGFLGQSRIAVIDGVSFTDPDDFETWLRLTGQLVFNAPAVTAPSLTSGDPPVARLTAPFTFEGQVAGFRDSGGATPLFEVDLFGRGSARLSMVGVEGLWRAPEVHFTFEDQAPIPEPASLLLLGGGLAGLLLRSRHARLHRP